MGCVLNVPSEKKEIIMQPRIAIEENGGLLMQVYCHERTSNSGVIELLQDAILTLQEIDAETPCSEPACKIIPFRRKDLNHETDTE
jgi:hypothetical protein